MAQEKLSSLYEKYKDVELLAKFEQYAKWTTASVFPTWNDKMELKGNDPVERDYQSTGAILVNNLASKLVQYLFPVSTNFFRLRDTAELKDFLRSIEGTGDVTQRLVDLERNASELLFDKGGYAQLHQLMRILIVTGNALLQRKAGKLIVHSPRNFVTLRDGDGAVLDCILKERVTYGRLPKEARLLFRTSNKGEFDLMDLYTRIKRITDEFGREKFLVYQEVEQHRIGKSIQYHKDLCPFIPVVWDLINSDSYGHGLVSEYAGDFARLSMLSEASAKYQIDACKVVNLVKPGSVADIDALAQATCGEYVAADPESVAKSETGDASFIGAISQVINMIENSLSVAFMYSANVRDAERVTAEEIRMKVAEVDKTLGGVYSKLSEQLHTALAYLLCAEVSDDFRAAIASDKLKVEMLIGTAALGRTSDIERLLNSIQVLSAVVPAAKQISTRFDTEAITDKVLLANNINLTEIMKSEEQLRSERDAAQRQMQSLQQMQQPSVLDAGSAAGQLLGGY